ncbi:MAG: TauD/TfdA family dioxygenase [Planctomycetota bacterium]|nr:TauD/TfdA family dioxygenase [Planctomycetota bacterium]
MDRRILEHRATWQGAALLSRPDWHQSLSEELIRELRHALGQKRTQPIDGPRVLESPKLRAFADEIRENLERGSGAVLISGFPISEFSKDEVEEFFWTLGSLMGQPLSQSALGEKIYRVRDSGFQLGHSKARGPNTRRALSFHTDRCDAIGFLCVRPAKLGGENYIASSISIHNEILRRRPDLLEVLYQPFHYQRHNIDHGNAWPFCKQPIFSVFEGHFAANILRVLIERAHKCDEIPDLTNQQRAALDLVESIAREESFHHRFRLEAGEMFFLNNFVVFHSRSEFEDFQAQEKRRELLRIWLSMPNSRPLSPEFRSHYGATEAGALRGGIHPKPE